MRPCLERRILITGCGGPIGVNVTRSLRASGRPWRLFGTDCNHYHLPLALTDVTRRIPPAKAAEAYVDALKGCIAEWTIDLILPTHPVEVRAISAARDSLGAVGMLLPSHQAILTAQDKWATYERLRDASLPVPSTRYIDTPEDLAHAFETISTRPIWVRGAGVPGIGVGVASLPCRELSHAEAWVDHHRGWGYFIASEYLPGRNLTWCGLFAEGALIACQSRERLAYVLPHVSPSGVTGAPAVSRTITEPPLREVGERAVRALDQTPNGVFFVDLKEDTEGQARITEINAGRFGTTIHFYTEAGCNFPALLVRLGIGEVVAQAPLIDPVPAGTYWIRTLDCGPVLLRQSELPADE